MALGKFAALTVVALAAAACTQTAPQPEVAPAPVSPAPVSPAPAGGSADFGNAATGPVTVTVSAVEGPWTLQRAPAGTRCDVVLTTRPAAGGGYAVDAPGCRALPGLAVWEPSGTEFVSLRGNGGRELVIVRSVNADRFEGWTMEENSVQISLSR